MVVCCQCNRDGKCKNCACVKAGRSCTTCLPLRRGHCSNTKQPSASAISQISQVPPFTTNSLLPATDPTVNTTTSSTTLPATFSEPTVAPILSASSNTPSNAHLPSPRLVTQTPFVWGDYDSVSYTALLSVAYLEIVHWKKNTFQVPLGKGGKDFVKELSRLLILEHTPSPRHWSPLP